jgi:two-component system, cell cycle sensor histidine kinase and response regulator CckA
MTPASRGLTHASESSWRPIGSFRSELPGTTKERAMPKGNILVVEDEAIIAADLMDRLRAQGYLVCDWVPTGEEAIARAASEVPDLVLMDIVLQGKLSGIDAAAQIRDRFDIPVVFVTSHGDADTVARATASEPFGYVMKPFNDRELDAAIQIGLVRHRAEARIREAERHLATTLASIGDAVIATDARGIVTLANPVAERLIGWPGREAIGRPLSEVFRAIDGATLQPLVDDLKSETLQSATRLGGSDLVYLRSRNGAETPIDERVSPIRDDAGNVGGMVVVFRDCSERLEAAARLQALNRELEQRVRERTAGLAEANRELADFTYSLSHDLRAPLRTLNAYTHLVAEKCQGLLDEEGQRFLSTIRATSQQMGQMIEDFLKLFRLRSDPLKTQLVDMNAVVQDVVATLTAHHAGPAAAIEIRSLLPAHADPGLIRQVWVNLVSNALKFTRERQHPAIEIGATDRSAETVYYVKDNGAGFDPKYVDKLFGIFQTLHRRDRFEGNGIGLATVARIVKRHGGRVSAEGTPEAGATFFFTLPHRPVDGR